MIKIFAFVFLGFIISMFFIAYGYFNSAFATVIATLVIFVICVSLKRMIEQDDREILEQQKRGQYDGGYNG